LIQAQEFILYSAKSFKTSINWVNPNTKYGNTAKIGKGGGLRIYGVESSSFVSPNDSHITFKLNNLLHVPSITKKLVK